MLIVGEKINSSIKTVSEAIERRDTNFIQDLACRQAAAGANWLDVNTGARPLEEVEDMLWLVETVQAVVKLPLCLDSPRPAVITRALELHTGRALINSITAEPDRMESVLPLVKEYDAAVIALCCGPGEIPNTAVGRLAFAETILKAGQRHGIPAERVYFDPLVFPVSLQDHNAVLFLETLRGLKAEFPEANTISGLSNISHGLPKRRIINRAFLILAMGAGMDAAILDPLDAKLTSLIKATELLLGQDSHCVGYLKAFRRGILED